MSVMSSNSVLTLYHGSRMVVRHPRYGIGNPFNDYGLGFYCTEFIDLAREWACPELLSGFVNEYHLPMKGLRVLDLDAPNYSSLNWIAVLLAHRKFDITTPVMARARDFMLERYAICVDEADVVAGYRADDSYFSFARAFLDNRISLRQLEAALRFGELGRQVVIKSPRAFDALAFVREESVDGSIWHPKRMSRDRRARNDYKALVVSGDVQPDDIFMIDLLRGAVL